MFIKLKGKCKTTGLQNCNSFHTRLFSKSYETLQFSFQQFYTRNYILNIFCSFFQTEINIFCSFFQTEIERLENEMLVCRHDNEQLRHQVQGQLDTRSCDSSSSKTAPSGGHEVAMLGVLTTKLQEAAAQSEKMKAELKKLKQVI